MTMLQTTENSRRWQGQSGAFTCLGDQFRSGQSWSDQLSGNQMLMPPEQLTEGEKLIDSGSGRGHYCISTLWSASIFVNSLTLFVWAGITESHRLSGLNKGNVLSHNSGSCRFQIKVCQGEFLVGTLSLVSVQLTFPLCLTWSFLSAPVERKTFLRIFFVLSDKAPVLSD